MLKALVISSVVFCSTISAPVTAAADQCSVLVDPVAQLTCWLEGPGMLPQPMGPGSGGTGGSEEAKQEASK